MADTFVPRLRPNTFLLLLIRSAKSNFGTSPRWQTPANKLTRATLLADLMKVLDTSSTGVQDTLTSYMAEFMAGSRPYSETYFPFDNLAFQSKVENRMSTDYFGALHAMDDLCHKFLSIDDALTMRFLVGGIIETLLQDSSFDAIFSITRQRVSKTDLANMVEIPLQPFLLEVWRQIALDHHDSREASETYQKWTAAGSPRRITTTIGANTAKIIAVSTALPESETDTSEYDGEPIILETDLGHGDSDVKQQTLNHRGSLFIQHAEKITNIEHVETLYI